MITISNIIIKRKGDNFKYYNKNGLSLSGFTLKKFHKIYDNLAKLIFGKKAIVYFVYNEKISD